MKGIGDFEDILAATPPGKAIPSRLHLILLDNDRMNLLRSEFKDFFLCIGCRVCTASCPAHRSGKPLSPRDLVSNVKKYLPQVGPGLLDGEAPPFPDGAFGGAAGRRDRGGCSLGMYACQACLTACPLELRHTDAIMGLRRNLAMIATSNKSSRAIRNPMRNLELKGHPWAGINLQREGWTEGLDIAIMADHAGPIDILYWVGCTLALDDRGGRVARATASLMKRAGDRGSPSSAARSAVAASPSIRWGTNTSLEVQAERNVAVLKGYAIRRIVTSCPHCYNMLKREYPRFGGEFEVIHHTELFDQLLKEGRLRVGGGTGKR